MMNKINKIAVLLLLGVGALIAVSCNDNDDWTPGPQPSPDNQGVYFDKNNPLTAEMEANPQTGLTQDYFTLALGRDASKTGSTLQVPVIVRYAESNLSVPQTVTFEAGSSTAELKISIKDYTYSIKYGYSVEIEEKYGDPYKIAGGSTRFDGNVEVVCLLANATFTPADYSGTTPPQFTPFQQKIYDNLDGTYTIKNFLYNNAGHSFSFKIDAANNIQPVLSCGYHDNTELRWYFYSANSSATTNQIPCYIPGANAADNVTYIYFYTAENPSSYTAFWLNLETKSGRMMGYSRYTLSSSGRIAFNISWD